MLFFESLDLSSIHFHQMSCVQPKHPDHHHHHYYCLLFQVATCTKNINTYTCTCNYANEMIACKILEVHVV